MASAVVIAEATHDRLTGLRRLRSDHPQRGDAAGAHGRRGRHGGRQGRRLRARPGRGGARGARGRSRLARRRPADEALALRAAGTRDASSRGCTAPTAPRRARRGGRRRVRARATCSRRWRPRATAGRPARVHVVRRHGTGPRGRHARRLPALLDAPRRPRARGSSARRNLVASRVGGRAGSPDDRRAGARVPAALALAREAGSAFEVRHLANSAATLTRPDLRFDLVRPGIAVYGLPPVADPDGRRLRTRPGDVRDRDGGAREEGSRRPGRELRPRLRHRRRRRSGSCPPDTRTASSVRRVGGGGRRRAAGGI